jgi:hypothetical protein
VLSIVGGGGHVFTNGYEVRTLPGDLYRNDVCCSAYFMDEQRNVFCILSLDDPRRLHFVCRSFEHNPLYFHEDGTDRVFRTRRKSEIKPNVSSLNPPPKKKVRQADNYGHFTKQDTFPFLYII